MEAQVTMPTNPLDEWQAWLDRANYRPRTKYAYMMYAKKLPLPHLIDQDFVNDFVEQHNYLTARAFIRNYVHEFLKKKDIEIPKVRGHAKRKVPVILSYDEVMRLVDKLAKTDKRVALIARIMFETASRIDEILTLQAENIDLRTPNHYTIKGVGKGDVEFVAFITRPTAVMIVELVQAKQIYPNGTMFRDLRVKYVREKIQQLGKELFGKHIGTHTMKRSCLSYLLWVKKWPLEKVRRYGRHAKYETLKPYLEMAPGTDIEDDWKDAFTPSSSHVSHQS